MRIHSKQRGINVRSCTDGVFLFRFQFRIINVDLLLVWIISVDFSDSYITEDRVTAFARVGVVNESRIRKCAIGLPRGFASFDPFIQNILAYMKGLKKPSNS